MVGTHWEHFSHDADIGVRGIGSTRGEAFAQAATALTAVITDPATVHPTMAVAIACLAPDDTVLLVDWLNALIYHMATKHVLFGRFAVAVSDHRLAAIAWGEPVDRTRHQPAVEIKGATFTCALVEHRSAEVWRAQCVVDV